MNISLSPGNLRHPFWYAGPGSQLKLILVKPPSSQIYGMIITVHTTSQPYIYKIEIKMENGKTESTEYSNLKKTIKKVRESWLQYYEDRTQVEFIERTVVDVPKSNTLNESSPRTRSNSSSGQSNTVDSCPPTPSPRSLRKNSMKMMLRGIATNYRQKKSDTESYSLSTSSSRSSSRSSSKSNSKSSSKSNSKSSSKSNSKSNSQTSSNETSPREGDDNNNITQSISPRTTRLLRKVSLQLALKTNPAPPTPRNSFS